MLFDQGSMVGVCGKKGASHVIQVIKEMEEPLDHVAIWSDQHMDPL